MSGPDNPQFGDIVKGKFRYDWLMMYLGTNEFPDGSRVSWYLVLSDSDPEDTWPVGRVLNAPAGFIDKYEWLTSGSDPT